MYPCYLSINRFEVFDNQSETGNQIYGCLPDSRITDFIISTVSENEVSLSYNQYFIAATKTLNTMGKDFY